MKRTYKDYLIDIFESLTRISEFIHGMNYNDFINDTKTVYAVIRALEIIGEATKNIPDSIRDKHPHLTWKSMAGMRDKLIHAYFGERMELIWNTVSQLLHQLKKEFQQDTRRYTRVYTSLYEGQEKLVYKMQFGAE